MSQTNSKPLKFYDPSEEPTEIDDAAWRRARSAIDKLKRAYVDEWAPASLDELDRLLSLALSNPDQAADQLEAAYRLAHDLKGQGATFGYSLVSDIGLSLCTLTEERTEATAAELQTMLAHVEVAREVLTREIEDAGSPEAAELMLHLQSVVRANLH